MAASAGPTQSLHAKRNAYHATHVRAILMLPNLTAMQALCCLPGPMKGALQTTTATPCGAPHCGTLEGPLVLSALNTICMHQRRAYNDVT